MNIFKKSSYISLFHGGSNSPKLFFFLEVKLHTAPACGFFECRLRPHEEQVLGKGEVTGGRKSWESIYEPAEVNSGIVSCPLPNVLLAHHALFGGQWPP